VGLVDGALVPAGGLDALRGRRVLLLAGIARPGGFRRTLAALGAEVAAEAIFPDHHRFAPGDLEGALRAADAARCELVVTTEKDAVRLPLAAAADPRVRAVRIEAEIVRGGDSLEAALDAALKAGPSAVSRQATASEMSIALAED
jgi:tetraacyldisaccharide 4'-kinase